jgi:hypothetical protein
VLVMVVITISNGDDVDAESKRGGDGVITISTGDGVDVGSERGEDGCDHYQHWR